jgi:hypothetical protein
MDIHPLIPHDSSSGYVANEHIDWTNTDENLLTTGTGSFLSLNLDSYLDLTEISAPSTPAANVVRLYSESIHDFPFLKYIDDGGMKRELVRDSLILVYNNSGSDMLANRCVYATGSSGNVPTVALAKANAEATMPCIGVTIEGIANNAYGRVMQVGLLENLNTNALTEGDVLYVHDTVAGLVRITPPVTPALTQEIGTVLVKSATVGAIQIIARGLTGNEFGTLQNTFIIGDGGAGSKTLTFNAATDASIIWDGAKFDFGANNLLTTGTGSFLSLALTGGTQDYVFQSRSNTALALESGTSATGHQFEQWTKDGDATDNNLHVIYGKGTIM